MLFRTGLSDNYVMWMDFEPICLVVFGKLCEMWEKVGLYCVFFL